MMFSMLEIYERPKENCFYTFKLQSHRDLHQEPTPKTRKKIPADSPYFWWIDVECPFEILMKKAQAKMMWCSRSTSIDIWYMMFQIFPFMYFMFYDSSHFSMIHLLLLGCRCPRFPCRIHVWCRAWDVRRFGRNSGMVTRMDGLPSGYWTQLWTYQWMKKWPVYLPVKHNKNWCDSP